MLLLLYNFTMVLSEKPRHLKIDNWGIFVLQKLESFYTRGDLCDLTLRFNDGKEIAVHKALLMGCTDYFKCLPTSSSGRVLQMPDTLKHEYVLPIINFMYSGKLEYKPEVHTALYDAAKALNMTVLAKLFDAQLKAATSPPPVIRSYVRKPATPVSPSSNSDTASTSTAGSTALPGKKLPIWKKRSAPGYLPDEFYQTEAMQVYKQANTEPEEVACPTRFEWPDENEEPPILYNPTFDTLSYTTKPMVKPPVDLKCDEPAPAKLPISTSETPKMMPTKRMLPSTIIGDVKRTRMSERVYSALENEEDDDDDDDGHFETLHDLDYDDEDEEEEVEEFVPASLDSSRVTNTARTTVSTSATFVTTLSRSSSVTTPTKSIAPETLQKITIPQTCQTPQKLQTPLGSSTVQTPKPILKVLSSEQTTPPPTKKVRFSLSEGKENNKDKETVPTPVRSQAQTVTIPITSSPNSSAGSMQQVNHAKIIAEVLKKYPDLVKNNKNIKLKILGPGKSPGNKMNASTPKKPISYVVMKSDVTSPKQMPGKSSQMQSGAENTNGPWLCHKCTDNDEPIQFDTYYLYRKHLQDVHMERIDARICEYCGLKSSKRNLHLYHMYTKHNIAPPRNINFPKCDQCDYIALSESLLIKHRNNHSTTSKDYICRICNAAFKSNGALQGHMTTNLHDHGKKNYQCKYCKKIFNRNINLKAHIRTAHQEECRKLYEDEEKQDDVQEQSDQNVLQIIELPVINSVSSDDKDQPHTLILPSGMTILAESPSVPLMPSSESEAMTNVASGIAASINLANANVVNNDQNVILLDENSDFICFKEHIVLNHDGSCQEYIVPEIVESDSGQVYATGLVNYTISNGNVNYTNNNESVTDRCSVSGYNNGEIIHAHGNGNITSGSDHTYAEDSGQTARQEDRSVSDDSSVPSSEHIIPDLEITESSVENLQPNNIVENAETQDYTQISNELIVDSESGNLIMNANWIQINSDKQQVSKNVHGHVIRDMKGFIGQNVSQEGLPDSNERHLQNSDSYVQNKVNLEMVNNISKEWDFDDDNVDEAEDGDEDTELKPTRPTIDLDVPNVVPTDI